MANLLEDIQCAGFDTRPPMLDRTDFASWQQRIRLYCQGKENGVNILKSIDEGPFLMGTVREPLAEGTEGAPHLGPARPWIYSDLSPEETDRFVTVVKLNRGLRDINYDQLYDYLKQHETHAKENKMMLERFSQHTVDPLALMSNVSYPQHYSPLSSTTTSTYVPSHLADNAYLGSSQNRGQVMNPWGRGAARYVGVQNRVGNANPGQARQAQENRVALDAEQLLFLTGVQDIAIDDDVDEQPVQDSALNVDNVFRADGYPVTDEAGPSYDLNILSEVQDHDHYQDAFCAHHEEHGMHDNVQLNHVVDSHADYTSDGNMILYDQYVKDNAVPVVHSNVSSIPTNAYMMIYNDMYEPYAQLVSNIYRNTVVENSLTAKLATYKEQVELYERRAKFELTK
uniref:Integrase, catalytic region, zinc finger, CCHC-type, peptidase aspartic, catalytic n=1 Tax=Tanacetum cinerariifolium TaxID=118510 RepID=A0A6L2MH24_TANCI|nr:integrase, catalytic region, zinc finger, CCHC-type, peptidase aspartic, catalytic [Tanacetum cinerariifolium]